MGSFHRWKQEYYSSLPLFKNECFLSLPLLASGLDHWQREETVLPLILLSTCLSFHLSFYSFFWHTWSLIFATAEDDFVDDEEEESIEVWGAECRDEEEDAANLDFAASSKDDDEARGLVLESCRVWQLSPSPQEQRWNSSSPWCPLRRCRVQTCPSRNTGLQIRVQKWRAQQKLSEQSEDRRQGSPTWPGDAETETLMCEGSSRLTVSVSKKQTNESIESPVKRTHLCWRISWCSRCLSSSSLSF